MCVPFARNHVWEGSYEQTDTVFQQNFPGIQNIGFN
jgi:hypothetical protein